MVRKGFAGTLCGAALALLEGSAKAPLKGSMQGPFKMLFPLGECHPPDPAPHSMGLPPPDPLVWGLPPPKTAAGIWGRQPPPGVGLPGVITVEAFRIILPRSPPSPTLPRPTLALRRPINGSRPGTEMNYKTLFFTV